MTFFFPEIGENGVRFVRPFPPALPRGVPLDTFMAPRTIHCCARHIDLPTVRRETIQRVLSRSYMVHFKISKLAAGGR